MSSNNQQQQLDKVRFDVNKQEEKITDEENKILTTENEKIWHSGDNPDFQNASYDTIANLCPAFVIALDRELAKSENSNKKVSFTYEGYLFGINKNKTTGLATIWRKRMNTSSGGSGSYQSSNKPPPMPLDELFCGTIEDCNRVLNDDKTKRWYLATQEIINDTHDGTVTGYAILKRNRFIPQGSSASSSSL